MCCARLPKKPRHQEADAGETEAEIPEKQDDVEPPPAVPATVRKLQSDDGTVVWEHEEALIDTYKRMNFETDPRNAEIRRQFVAEACPPDFMRLVARATWNDPDQWQSEGTKWLDPFSMTRVHWNMICEDKAKTAAYACCIDRRWPGYFQQPWFVSMREIEEAVEEGRITTNWGRQCKELLRTYGDCMNRSHRTLLGQSSWLMQSLNSSDVVLKGCEPDVDDTGAYAPPVDMNMVKPVITEDDGAVFRTPTDGCSPNHGDTEEEPLEIVGDADTDLEDEPDFVEPKWVASSSSKMIELSSSDEY